MYIVPSEETQNKDEFNWSAFFNDKLLKEDEIKKVYNNARNHLKENKFLFTLIFDKVIKKSLLKSKINLKKPNILELGAATGFLTRYLISNFGGCGVLVDNNEASFKAYSLIKDNIKEKICYEKKDLFKYKSKKKFDIVCSFGLIEHFENKNEVLNVHKKFIHNNGLVIIVIPLDSPLTRTFYEIHKELNLGYRELMTKKEFYDVLCSNGYNVENMAISLGYCYDFIVAICTLI